jgi:hypothetical protein
MFTRFGAIVMAISLLAAGVQAAELGPLAPGNPSDVGQAQDVRGTVLLVGGGSPQLGGSATTTTTTTTTT